MESDWRINRELIGLGGRVEVPGFVAGTVLYAQELDPPVDPGSGLCTWVLTMNRRVGATFVIWGVLLDGYFHPLQQDLHPAGYQVWKHYTVLPD